MENKMEFYTVKPNLKQIYGKKITKDLEFDEWTKDKTVHQILKNCTLTTIIDNEYEVNGLKVKEHSNTEVTYPEGYILIWNEKIGYVTPQVQVCTLDDVRKEVDEIDGIYKDIYKNEKGE